jgi:hypothetical protein
LERGGWRSNSRLIRAIVNQTDDENWIHLPELIILLLHEVKLTIPSRASSEIDSRGDHEETISYSLSAQSLWLLHRIAKLEIYGETSGEVGARFIDLALQEFVARPRFVISRNRSKCFLDQKTPLTDL